MKRRSAWFWVAIAYLAATVTYNLSTQWVWFASYSTTKKLGVGLNLGCKVLAIGLLIFRRPEGVYFLVAAFLIGLSATAWGFYTDGDWMDLPPLMKIERINGFVISLVIILYMTVLLRRGTFAGRQNSS
jgi:hypothetical protein